MEMLLGLVCAWVGLTAAALGAALTDRPGALGNYLVGASLVVGAAISSTILMLPYVPTKSPGRRFGDWPGLVRFRETVSDGRSDAPSPASLLVTEW
jgi:hypothetical protein